MQVVIYEDGHEARFGPLALLRPAFDLRCGALLLREKLELRRPSWRCLLLPRPALADVVSEQHPGRGAAALRDEPTLFLSARVIADDALLSEIERLAGDARLTAGGMDVGAFVRSGAGDVLEQLNADRDLSRLGLEAAEAAWRTVAYPWDLVAATPDEIAGDAALADGRGERRGVVDASARLLNPSGITIGPGSHVAPGAVLDAREGEILIGRDVTVMPNTFIEGPAAIGDGTWVKAGTRIYGGTSVGPRCKVGGEIEGSIIHSYSNKQHEGFLGHSYVGSWVNLGAATDVSDLKNNYGSVRVHIDGEDVDTGLTFVGAVIGDHSKTAIGTKLNTGTIVGVFCNVYPGSFPPKSLPSFSWGAKGGFEEHDVERALETARRAMARRDVRLTAAQEALIRRVFMDARRSR